MTISCSISYISLNVDNLQFTIYGDTVYSFSLKNFHDFKVYGLQLNFIATQLRFYGLRF